MSQSGQFYGYARVSTADQDLAIQEAALRAAGCTVSIDAEEVRSLVAAGNGASEVAKRFGIGRASVYRSLRSVETATESRSFPSALNAMPSGSAALFRR